MPKSKRIAIIFLVAVFAGAAAVGYWILSRHKSGSQAIALYGNVDIRQTQLAFNDSGRIIALLVQEGDKVHRGQLVARLDPLRFRDAVARAQASLSAQRSALAKLRAGTRPQEIAEARAGVDAAQAAVTNAQISYRRRESLVTANFLPKQTLDDAARTLRVAKAEEQRAQQALSLALQGPRKEDIESAAEQVKADEATLALAKRELADTDLLVPESGVVESRILEVGDMAGPQTPVMTIALDNPVWVRAYLPEVDLGRVAPGMRADIFSDSFPGVRFAGWIGFISPTAEFTPKSVQTTELRTELVYRTRVYVCNPEGQLRLGMPVTVKVSLEGNHPDVSSSHACDR